MMKKRLVMINLFVLSMIQLFCTEVKLVIQNVKPDAGKVMVSVNYTEESFKKHRADSVLVLDSYGTEIEAVIEIAEGECAFSIFQDCNDDGKLNASVIGLPKEPFGFSNYDGKSVPGNFSRHKVFIKDGSEVTVRLYTLGS